MGSAAYPYGVPQRTVLAPLLFALYTADLPQRIKGARVIMHADDVTLVTSAETPEGARKNMNEALRQVAAYCRGNRIAPCPQKTQLLVSGPRSKEGDLRDLACAMGEAQIIPSDVIRVLGVLLGKDLTWDPQARAAATKAHVAVRRIARAADCLAMRDRKQLVQALALPHLDGCQTALAQPSEDASRRLSAAYQKGRAGSRVGPASDPDRQTVPPRSGGVGERRPERT